MENLIERVKPRTEYKKIRISPFFTSPVDSDIYGLDRERLTFTVLFILAFIYCLLKSRRILRRSLTCSWTLFLYIQNLDTTRTRSQLVKREESEDMMKRKNQANSGHNDGDNARSYEPMKNAPGINAFHQSSKKGMRAVEKLKADGITAEGTQNINGVKITLGNFRTIYLNSNTLKLWDMLKLELTKRISHNIPLTEKQIANAREVTITLDKFMSMCGLKHRQSAQEELRKSAQALFNVDLKFDDFTYEVNQSTGRKKRKKTHWSFNLFEATKEVRNLETDPIVDSKITFYFSYGLIEYCVQAYIMPFCVEALKISTHNYPHAYRIYFKLCERYNMEIIKGKPVRISVATLREGCPDLPRNEEVKGRHHWQLIFKPFDRDLSALSDKYGLVDCHYCNAGGEPITDEQLANFAFEDWENWLIEFTLPDYPPREAPKKRGRRGNSQTIAL